MVYGQALIEKLERENKILQDSQDRRAQRIANWETDEDDCFISDRVETQSIAVNNKKISLILSGGCQWFVEYATTDGQLVNANWCNTPYGRKLRVEMPDGSVVWTTGGKKSLDKIGLKKVECLRPAWFWFRANGSGIYGIYTGDYEMFPSDWNYATGEKATAQPLQIRDI